MRGPISNQKTAPRAQPLAILAIVTAIALLLVAPTCPAYAQLVLLESASAAVGGSISWGTDAGVVNPATTAGTEMRRVSLHAARPYHIPGLTAAAIRFHYATPRAGASVRLSSLGYDAHRVTTGRGTVARVVQIAPHTRVHLGAELIARSSRFAGQPLRGTVEWRAGWAFVADSLWSVAIVLDEQVASLMAGTAVWLAEFLVIHWRTALHERHGPSHAVGVAGRAGRHAELRLGYTTGPTQLAAGMGIRIRQVGIDYATVVHSELGLSSGITLFVDL